MSALPGFMALVTAERERALFGFCSYCGTPCEGRACRHHRDLIALDHAIRKDESE